MKFEVYYIERVVKKIIVDAPTSLDAGRNVIMDHEDVDYSQAIIVDSVVWAIEKVKKIEE